MRWGRRAGARVEQKWFIDPQLRCRSATENVNWPALMTGGFENWSSVSLAESGPAS